LYSYTEASIPNPPSLNLGAWEEETVNTQSLCGSLLSLTGEVQDFALGISEFDMDNAIKIFPNPATSFLNIQNTYNIDAISVYDIMGKLVLRDIQEKDKIDVTKLNSGLYFVRLHVNNNEIVKKLIIE
jgi:hypothetical protein